MGQSLLVVLPSSREQLDKFFDRLAVTDRVLFDTGRIIVVQEERALRSRRRINYLPVAPGLSLAQKINRALAARPEDHVLFCLDTVYPMDPGVMARLFLRGEKSPRPGLFYAATPWSGRHAACVLVQAGFLAEFGPLPEVDTLNFPFGPWEEALRAAGGSPEVCEEAVIELGVQERVWYEGLATTQTAALPSGSPESGVSVRPTPLLSVLVCALKGREELRKRLLDVLLPQINHDEVEYHEMMDGGEISIGAKRQRLLEGARGEYVCFVDDDDLVSVDYITRIVTALKEHPEADCVGFNSLRFMDGREDGRCVYSKRYTDWVNNPPGNDPRFERSPCHLTPVRRGIALRVGFTDTNSGEDRLYSQGIAPLIRNEVFLEGEPMYFYYFRRPPVRNEVANTSQQNVGGESPGMPEVAPGSLRKPRRKK